MYDKYIFICLSIIVILLIENAIDESIKARRCMKLHYLLNCRKDEIKAYKSRSRSRLSLYAALIFSVAAACLISR